MGDTPNGQAEMLNFGRCAKLCMVSYGLFWLIVAVFVGGQALLVRSAWRLRKSELSLPTDAPRGHGDAEVAWTLATAVLTGVLLYCVYLALI